MFDRYIREIWGRYLLPVCSCWTNGISGSRGELVRGIRDIWGWVDDGSWRWDRNVNDGGRILLWGIMGSLEVQEKSPIAVSNVASFRSV